jgi:pyruvate-formate lyase-activating enzyme
MNKQCRVIITTLCDKKCLYCCNNLPKVRQSFKMTTLDKIIEDDRSPYEAINLTGGEVGLIPDILAEICSKIKYCQPKTKIFVYTNGLLAKTLPGAMKNNKYRRIVDGFNVGCHGEKELETSLENAKILHKIAPCRLHIQDTVYDNLPYDRRMLINHAVGDKEIFAIKKWHLNNCDNEKEDRCII